MAEKEERIYVYRFTDDDGICPLEEICTKFPRGCGNCKEIPTRTETVEKMAKALFKVDNVLALDIGFEQLINQKQLVYKVFAEAALNALLEGNK